MSGRRYPFPAPAGERARNNALTVFLLLETLILFVAAPLAAVGVQAPLFLGGLLGVSLLLAIVIISDSTVARVLTFWP
jgi:hypothetical protein